VSRASAIPVRLDRTVARASDVAGSQGTLGKFGRDRCGAAPMADSRFCTSDRCSISCAAMWKMCLRHLLTASSSLAVRPSPADCFRLNAAYRYWHMIPCSSSAASQSM